MKNNKTSIIIIVIIIALAGIGGAFLLLGGGTSNQDNFGKETAIVFKSPQCGCCVKYISYLKEQGFNVEVKNLNDMSEIKEEYNIPRNMQSCHTTVIGDYFIEGHIPIETVHKFLEENSTFDGIALPGMPSGSPGMPGIKSGPFTVYAISDRVPSEFMVE